MINGALPTVAALAGGHEIVLIDENVEEIDWDALDRFDIVGVTGMNVQRERQRQILERLREIDTYVVVGGPYVSVKEEAFEGLCDTMFVGEADETWPRFLDDFAAGRPVKARYEQEGRTDMTTLPVPRYDLLRVDRYASGSLQFSRGCPFQCEFCDIIVIFGRVPRTKKPAQVIAELEEMRKAGFFSAMIVDDNFIGNKKEAKEVLREIAIWQREHNYPLRLSTEASINLADDPVLLELMYEANFRSVFIGIETPREASLEETKKFQNTRGDSMEDKLARVQRAGLDISAGFIVGFDNDDLAIFEDQYRFIQDNGILLAMVGMLGAIPKTPLYERLEKEGRLVEEDPNCNFHPKQMTREQLRTNYWELVGRLYTPEAFFERYFSVYKNHPEFERKRAEICEKAGEGKMLPTLGYGLISLWKLAKALVPRRLARQRRPHLLALLLARQPQAPPRRDRLRAVHEPLRHPLALLHVHARDARGTAAHLQQRVRAAARCPRGSRRRRATGRGSAARSGPRGRSGTSRRCARSRRDGARTEPTP